MSLTNKLSKSLTIALMIIGLMLTMSCENKWSVDPNDSAVEESRQVTILRTNGDRSLDKAYEAKAWITEKGGSLWVGDTQYNLLSTSKSLTGELCTSQTNLSGLVFPEGAVDAGVAVYMFWESEDLLQADFYPEGIQFNEPVYIRLSYKDTDLTGINEEDLAIYYYNPDTGNWDLVSNNVNTAEDYVEGYIHHFSRYAVGLEP